MVKKFAKGFFFSAMLLFCSCFQVYSDHRNNQTFPVSETPENSKDVNADRAPTCP